MPPLEGLFGPEEIELGVQARAELKRNSSGEWELADLDIHQAALDGVHLRIDGARIEYQDEELSPSSPLELDLRSVSLEISDLAPGSRARFKLKASLPDHKDLFALEGAITLQEGSEPQLWPFEASMRVRGYPLDSLTGLLAHAAGIRAEGGSVDLEITASGTASKHLSISGKLGVHKTHAAPIPRGAPAGRRGAASIAAQGARLVPVECDVEFDLEVTDGGNRVGVTNLRFTFPESHLAVTGSFVKGPGGIWVDLTVPDSRITARDIRILTPALKLEFPPGLTASEPFVLRGRVSGPLERPQDLQVTGSLGLRGVRFESPALGKPVEDVAARVEFTRDSVKIRDLTASLGTTRVSGSLELENFAAPRVRFDLASEKADLGELLALLQPATAGTAKSPSGTAATDTASRAAPATTQAGAPGASNLLLESVTGRGTLRIKEGVLGTFDFAGFEGTVAMKGLHLEFDPLAFRLYGGTYRGGATVDFSAKEPRYTYRMRLEGVHAGPLIADNLGADDLFGGVLAADLELSASGRDYDTIINVLTGRGSIRMLDDWIGRFNVMDGIAKAADLFGEATLRDLGRNLSQQKTHFRELSGDVRVEGGKVSSRNLKLLSENLDLHGKGSFTLSGNLDFDLKVVFSDALSRLMEREGSKARYLGREGDRYAVPVKISGPILSLSFSLDLRKVARSAAKEKLKDTIAKKLGLNREALRRLSGEKPPSAPGSARTGASSPTPQASAAPLESAVSSAVAAAPTPAVGAPEALAIRITEARLRGNFLKRELKLKGVFSGTGIDHADLIVTGQGSRILHEERGAFPEIETYFASHDRSAAAEIAFSRRVKGLLLPIGSVDVTLILYGSDGRKIGKTVTADR